QMPTEDEY
nr:Chain B, receptor activator of nuclear factor-kappa B [Homo sapiens]